MDDPSDAAAAAEFVARFRETRETLRTELTFTGEPATIRHVLDHGSPSERSTLLIVLGRCANVVVRLRTPDEDGSPAAEAADERARRYLRGLIGEGEPVDKATLRPTPEAMHDEDVFVLDTSDPDAKLQRRH